MNLIVQFDYPQGCKTIKVTSPVIDKFTTAIAVQRSPIAGVNGAPSIALACWFLCVVPSSTHKMEFEWIEAKRCTLYNGESSQEGSSFSIKVY